MTITVKRPEGVVQFCTDLALRGQWEDANEVLERVRTGEGEDLRLVGDVATDNERVQAAAAVVQGLEAQMRASILRFRIRGLPRREWQELGEANPPNDEDPQDRAMGVHVATFFDAVAKVSIYSVNDAEGEPVDFDAKNEWDQLADDMTNGQWQEFADEFLRLNRQVTDAPFSRTASLMMQPSEETSN